MEKQSGAFFSKLLIFVVVVIVLYAVVMPYYRSYLRKSYYANLTKFMNPYVTAVGNCFQNSGALAGCTNGQNGTLPDKENPTENISSIKTSNGVVTLVPKESNGLTANDTYILSPTVLGERLTWSNIGSGCLASGSCD